VRFAKCQNCGILGKWHQFVNFFATAALSSYLTVLYLLFHLFCSGEALGAIGSITVLDLLKEYCNDPVAEVSCDLICCSIA
jgi:hypothetical protein